MFKNFKLNGQRVASRVCRRIQFHPKNLCRRRLRSVEGKVTIAFLVLALLLQSLSGIRSDGLDRKQRLIPL